MRECIEDAECGISPTYVTTSCGDYGLCVDGACTSDNPNTELGVGLCEAEVLEFGPSSGPIALGDMTGDGLVDLVYLDGGLQLAAGRERPPAFAMPALAEAGATVFALGDLDGDGVVEAVVGTAAGDHLELAAVRALAGGFATEPLGVELPPDAMLRVRDMDASGLADVIALDGAGHLTVLVDPVLASRTLEGDVALESLDMTFLQGSAERPTLVLDGGSLVGVSVAADGELDQVELANDSEPHTAMVVADFDLDDYDDLALMMPSDKILIHWGAVGPSLSGETLTVPAEQLQLDHAGHPLDALGELDPEAAAWSYAARNASERDGGARLVALRADGALVSLSNLRHDFTGPIPAIEERAPHAALSFFGTGRGNAVAIGGPGAGLGLVVSSVPLPNQAAGPWNPKQPELLVARECGL